jgi:hypothetical protein
MAQAVCRLIANHKQAPTGCKQIGHWGGILDLESGQELFELLL